MRTTLLAPILLAAALLALSACGSAPPPGPQRVTVRSVDQDACSTAVHTEVTRRDSKTFPRWLASGFTRWTEIDGKVDSCMQAKDYAVTRACTDEERLHPTPAVTVLVTQSGIRCQTAGKAS